MTQKDILDGRGQQPTKARRKPLQARAQKRHDEILDITADLLARVGVDELTTILIAKSLGISVGSLYHYFPNKIAILYALAQRWLDDITEALDDIDDALGDEGDLRQFTDQCSGRILEVYRRQRGILHLVQAISIIPELRELDELHDRLMIRRFARIFVRLGVAGDNKELKRIAGIYLELVHALALVIVEQKGARAKRTTEDMKFMANELLARHYEASGNRAV